jgi:sulfonate transport system substrate-binding protein
MSRGNVRLVQRAAVFRDPARRLMSIRSLPPILLLACIAACGRSGGAAPTAEQDRPATVIKPQAGDPVVVRLGYQKIGSPFLLKERADALQLKLAQHNARAEWVEFQAGPPLLEAMRANAIDIGHVGETPPVFAQSGGVPFVYVASDAPAPAAEAILVPSDSPIHTVADLKGKRIAVNRGSNVHYLLVRALDSVKLTLKDVTVTYLAPPDARTAFDSKQVDAWVIWDPFQAAAELKGARTLRDGDGLVDNRFFYVARREFNEKSPQLVRLVLEAYQELSTWAKTHPEEAATVLARSSGIAYDALLRAEKRHIYELQPITPGVLEKQQTIANVFHDLELIPRAIRTVEAFSNNALSGNGT